MTGERFRVVLAGIPRNLVEYGVERTEELLREFRLIADGGPGSDELARRLTRVLGSLRGATDGRAALVAAGLEEAPADGSDPVYIELWLPAGAERDALEIAELMDESDEYCRRGQVLTLPRTPALVALRWWQATEVVRQRHGLAPTPYVFDG